MKLRKMTKCLFCVNYGFMAICVSNLFIQNIQYGAILGDRIQASQLCLFS